VLVKRLRISKSSTDGVMVSRFDDVAYIDLSNPSPLPKVAEKFSLPNGLLFEALSLSEYRLNYDSHNVSLDLHCKSFMAPYDIRDAEMDPMAVDDPDEAAATSGFVAVYLAHFEWAKLEKKLRKHYPKGENGQPPYPLPIMLREIVQTSPKYIIGLP